MKAIEQLNAYVQKLESRLRLHTGTRGAAAVAGTALFLTIVFVWIANRYEFATSIVLPLRIVLFAAVAAVITCGLALPLSRITKRRTTRLAEEKIPDFEQRLLTASEATGANSPFGELIAEDALQVIERHSVEEIAPRNRLYLWLGSATASLIVLGWLITAGPGYWGYGSSLLWTGSGNAGKKPLYEVTVQPGNASVRRKADQMITARLLGFSARQVTLHARYAGTTRWDTTPMQPGNGDSYRFLFAGLSDTVEYYVQANAAISKHFTLTVRDLPAVKRVRTDVHFPAPLHIADAIQDPGGDIRAVTGSKADIAVLTDRPLARGILAMEDGSKIELRHGDGNWLTSTLPIHKDGSYHVAAIDGSDLVRISNDYFIESKNDEPPSVRIVKPGRDPHVSPIEEVPVSVEASDDFGVEGLELHYSVNGGPEQTAPLLKKAGVKEASGGTTFYLENFKLVPGDIVSFYATARDANTTSRSDMYFAQAEPFDYKFSQSQSAGGMGGMGGQDEQISERQKQVIAATFNELKDPGKAAAALREDAHFLSDLEGKIGDQAKTLAQRMANRELATPNSEFENFSKMMTQAAGETQEAADTLKGGKWREALSPEQKALQSLLRAEAMFRDIQVAFGQGNGMGGGAQRDLARMFDLELDTSKNQYETKQSGSQGGDQQKSIDDAFQKLEMLARRQQELAERASQQQPVEQRWQEEQLRREAEQLRQQMEQLSKNSQGQQGSQSESGEQSGSQSASRGRNSNSSQSARLSQAMREASQALQRAEEEMRKAVADRDPAAQRRSSEELAQAREALDQALHATAGNSVSQMAERAQQLADRQREIASRMKEMYGQSARSRGSATREGQSAEEGEMPAMEDPTNPGWGGMYRRRYWPQEIEPRRPATEQERALANEKERLAQQLDGLEHSLQQEEQGLSGTRPDAASKLRKALSEAEQEELATRMRKNAEWMREGFGDRNLGMEDKVTEGLEQLSRNLRDAQKAIESGDAGQTPAERNAERELAQVQRLRQMLQQGSQQGQAERQGQGQQQGRGQAYGQPGEEGEQAESGQFSQYGGPDQPGINSRNLDQMMTEMYALRRQIDPKDRQLYNYVDGTLGYLRDLHANPGVLDATVAHDALASLERLEVELSRRAGVNNAGVARTSATENAPEQYRNAVAEYFKKLSQPK